MSPKKRPEGENVTQRAIVTATSGTSYLILIQLASRFFTFAGNQVLLRFLTPATLGIALQLDLYNVTVLYFSRESLRVALQRQPLEVHSQDGEDVRKAEERRARQTQSTVNASYVAIAIGLPLATILATIYSQRGFQEVLDSPFFRLSLLIYGFATIVELLSEPAFVIIQQRGLYRSRAATETVAACQKCLAACLTAFLGKSFRFQVGVLPFAVGQLVYASAMFLGYLFSVYAAGKDDDFSVLLRRIQSSEREYWYQRFYKPLVSLAISMYVQTGIKQLLSQADSVILVALSSLEDQGAFALASNYGGLVARIIFQPIEESSRNAFGVLLSQGQPKENGEEGLKAAIRHFTDVLHFYSILSIFAFCFAPSLLPLLVRYVVGSRWFSPEVANLLSSYAIYIPFMAFNGITEAFVSSIATTTELRRQAVWMGGFTVAFAASAYLFLRVLDLGASGLVYANATNMLLRTTWSWWFVKRYTKRRDVALDVRNVMPMPMSIATGVAVGAYLRTAAKGGAGLIEFAIMIGVCGIGGLVIAFFERDFILPYVQTLIPKRLASKFSSKRS